MGLTFFVICGFSLISCIRLFAIRRQPAAVDNQLLAQLTDDSGVRDVISKESMRSIKNTLKFRYLFVLIWTLIVMLGRAFFETVFGFTGFFPQNDNCDVCGACQSSPFLLFTILVNEPIIQARQERALRHRRCFGISSFQTACASSASFLWWSFFCGRNGDLKPAKFICNSVIRTSIRPN